MSFEKQFCARCKKLTVCYHHESKDWYCNECYGWIIADANLKDEVSKILIECGMEDIENC